jgi:AraC family transcriptional regulator of adaptative response/methylated-DNA-[protein]-cysteine methyltransferase
MDAAAITRDPRWAALLARDGRADGTFFYSVRTTGVYCRPSCGARRANPANVRFHDTREEAEAAGFRPCRRCHPERPDATHTHAARIAHACRVIERAPEAPRLAALARRAGLSPYHFHRTFKAITGVTPHAYWTARRAVRLREELATEGKTVTAAIYDAGFNSAARFYAAAPGILGMTPTAFRAGGVDAEIRFAVRPCSLGSVLVAISERGICAIWLGDDPEAMVGGLQDAFPRATLIGTDPRFEELVGRVIALVEAPASRIDLPLDVRGTAFQQRVWQALRQIPPGATLTYQELAARIGSPRAVRAVAGACAANSLAVAIPCHRVVRSDGSPAGYRWGAERKRTLLSREAGRLPNRRR